MSDEEIIKRRLLIDGDGTGDDRRINMLLKQFLKWTFSKNDSPENNQIVFDRLMAQMAQCKFAASKTDYTSRMISEELKNYAKLSESIERCIEIAKTDIEESKKELIVAKQIRRNKMEYDMLAKVIKNQPDRKETTQQIETLKKELAELMENKIKLERKFQKRRNDFTLLMFSIRELQAQLDESSSEGEENEGNRDISKASDEPITDFSGNGIMEVSEDEEDNGILENIKIETPIKLEIKEEDSAPEQMSVDDDAVLELSLEKDEKMLENPLVT